MSGLLNLYFPHFVMLLTDLTDWRPGTLVQVTIWAMSNSKISSDTKWPGKEVAMHTFPSSDTD